MGMPGAQFAGRGRIRGLATVEAPTSPEVTRPPQRGENRVQEERDVCVCVGAGVGREAKLKTAD
jgi:hypothetical protein